MKVDYVLRLMKQWSYVNTCQSYKLSILSIPPLIPAGIDRNPTGINREHPYLSYILHFYFRNMFWNRGIDQHSIIFKNLTQ